MVFSIQKLGTENSFRACYKLLLSLETKGDPISHGSVSRRAFTVLGAGRVFIYSQALFHSTTVLCAGPGLPPQQEIGGTGVVVNSFPPCPFLAPSLFHLYGGLSLVLQPEVFSVRENLPFQTKLHHVEETAAEKMSCFCKSPNQRPLHSQLLLTTIRVGFL